MLGWHGRMGQGLGTLRTVGLAEWKNKHSCSVECLQSQFGASCIPVIKIYSLILDKKKPIYLHKRTVVNQISGG